jgi:DNA-binding NarL/FixJ family response regulator
MDGSGAIEITPATGLAIASSSTLLRVGLRVLADCPGCSLLGEVNSAERLLRYLQRADIGLVLLDEHLGGLCGPSDFNDLRKLSPDVRYLVFMGQTNLSSAYRWLGAGAAGCVSITDTFPQLRAAIGTVIRGGVHIPPAEPVTTNPDGPSWPWHRSGLSRALSSQQAEILDLALAGYDSKRIAQMLGLGIGTVRLHIAACCRAMGEQQYVHQRGPRQPSARLSEEPRLSPREWESGSPQNRDR